jgi:hypothetical protein
MDDLVGDFALFTIGDWDEQKQTHMQQGDCQPSHASIHTCPEMPPLRICQQADV